MLASVEFSVDIFNSFNLSNNIDIFCSCVDVFGVLGAVLVEAMASAIFAIFFNCSNTKNMDKIQANESQILM